MSGSMKKMRGIVQGFSDGRMSVLAEDNAYYQLPIPNPAPAIDQRIVFEMDRPDFAIARGEEQWSPEEVSQRMYRFDRIVSDTVGTAAEVTDQHIRQYHQQGFLVIDQLFDASEVDTIKRELQDFIYDRKQGAQIQYTRNKEAIPQDEDRELYVRKVQGYVEHSPLLKKITEHEGLHAVLSRIFGEQARLVVEQALLKPPSEQAGNEKPWHQDMAYGPFQLNKLVCGVWIALDQADLDNGCMHVVPGSHQHGPIPHYVVRDWQICDIHVDLEREVVVPLKPGGALLFTGLTHHGTPPNRSKKHRRALQLHYAPVSAEKIKPLEAKRMFTNDMTKAEC